jgi:peptidoglycan hydrolase CwlO-like protein
MPSPTNSDIVAQLIKLQATYEAGHAAVIDDLAELKAAAKTTNGRVNDLEKCQVLLAHMPDDIKSIKRDITAIQSEMDRTRGALALVKWALAGGLASLAALIAQILGVVP